MTVLEGFSAACKAPPFQAFDEKPMLSAYGFLATVFRRLIALLAFRRHRNFAI
jgi:hypothetical protein